MIRAEIVDFNKELLQKLKQSGIKLEDYKYCDLYRDYKELSRTERNRKVIFLTLAEHYGISDRQVYNIINHLKTPV